MMPSRICSHSVCRNVATNGGRCESHKRKAFAKRTGSGRGGRKWSRTRERIFKRDNFLCQEHLRSGFIVGVELHGPGHGICDHIVPEAEGGSGLESNLQTLCQDCSNYKSADEARRGVARG